MHLGRCVTSIFALLDRNMFVTPLTAWIENIFSYVEFKLYKFAKNKKVTHTQV